MLTGNPAMQFIGSYADEVECVDDDTDGAAHEAADKVEIVMLMMVGA